MISPHVVIAGGGPAGLLLALLLASHSIQTTILEKSSATDPWNARSYSINLNSRGLSALETAGALELAKAAGMARHQIVLESADGQRTHIPKNPPDYAFSRPDLVECLEGICREKHPLITIQRGAGVANVEEKADGTMQVTLDNGSKVTCTHVVGADGKWSAVRNSIADFNNMFKVQSEPAFGISIKPAISSGRWELDATSVFRPTSPKYYVLAAPLTSGRFTASIVCFDEVKEEHPWLVPRDDDPGVDWESEYGGVAEANAELQSNLAKMLEKDLPKFYEDIQGDLTTVRVNRRTSWLKPLVESPSYCSRSGSVALIGDAAHAMTPSVGEGCNCALESAVLLVQTLSSKDKPITVEDLTQAFSHYGTKRPTEVVPIQQRSANLNRYRAREAPGAKGFKSVTRA